MSYNAVGPEDFISVRGRYLYKKSDDSRFFVKGIAFPVPLLPYDYNATAWIDVLHQLRSLSSDINTVRIYSLNHTYDYSEFFNEAASLGIYVIVPLTSVEGNGVLNRKLKAPKCYSRKLYHYGVACLRNYLQYPNVLAGVVGNEVMNSLPTWYAAPCIKAYVADLKRLMSREFERPLPLMYTAQNSGIGAAITATENMVVTANYLTCSIAEDIAPTTSDIPPPGIDIFGINIESWCSSYATFEQNEDGSVGTYYSLWDGLHNASSALVLAEMGCPHSSFNRDNSLPDKVRDWKQVLVVLGEMSDTFSGFSAYTYDGNADFNMFEGGPWNGRDLLMPTKDFENFQKELAQSKSLNSSNSLETSKSDKTPSPPFCREVEANLRSLFRGVDNEEMELYDFDKMPSYSYRSGGQLGHGILLMLVAGVFGVTILILAKVRHNKRRTETNDEAGQVGLNVQYQSIN